MIVYKAFGPGLVCKGYHYKPGEVNCEAEANCVRNGIHAAENPADCLTYYRWDNKNEFWRCEAVGDIDEDGGDSKISTTELIPVHRLTLTDYIAECAWYILQHPLRLKERNGNITISEGTGIQSYGCTALIVAGEDPKAEVTRMENIVVLVDTKKGTMRAGKNLPCGWYQIGEGGCGAMDRTAKKHLMAIPVQTLYTGLLHFQDRRMAVLQKGYIKSASCGAEMKRW